MLVYILQVLFFQFLFLLVYELLLKKETFFTYNRWYLLFCAVISFLLPLIKIEAFSTLVPAESIAVLTNVWLPEVFIGNTPENIQYLPAVEVSSESTTINWWFIAYGVGLMGSLFLLFRKYQNLSRLFSFKMTSAQNDFRIIEVPDSTIACTFYKTVFLGDKLSEEEKQQILSHELVHVKQKHSLDLIFFESLKIIFWFNPLVYIYQSRISTLHEFIADAAVVKTTEKRSYYEQLLNSAFNTRNISFINQFFNHSLIKKRIVMLEKSKSKTIAKLKYLLIVPLMLVMLTVVSCSQDSPEGMDKESSISEQLAEIKQALDEGRELSQVERDQFFSIMEQIVKDDNGRPIPPPNPPNSNKTTSKKFSGNDVPFAVIDNPPLFMECDDLTTSDVRKKCTSDMITSIVNENFDTSLGKELGLKGVNRIIVQFKIDKSGNVVEARARAAHPDLETEALRVINMIPQMKPGRHQGERVSVVYSLPIVFQVGE